MVKGVTHVHLGPIWYHSEPSGVPYSPNQFLGWDFFCHFLQQDGSSFRNWIEFYPLVSLLFFTIQEKFQINNLPIQNINMLLCKGSDYVFGMAFGLVFMIESHKVEAKSLEMTFFTTTIKMFYKFK